jgi:hypothetical protein
MPTVARGDRNPNEACMARLPFVVASLAYM